MNPQLSKASHISQAKVAIVGAGCVGSTVIYTLRLNGIVSERLSKKMSKKLYKVIGWYYTRK